LQQENEKSIFQLITSEIVYDPGISIYYKRKKNEGKIAGVDMNTVNNKLIQPVFSVIFRLYTSRNK